MEEYIRHSLIQLLYRALLARKTHHTYTYALTLLHYLPSPTQMDAAYWPTRKSRLAIQSALTCLEAVLRQAAR